MSPITFAKQLQKHPVILGEGALIERLRRDSPFELDDQVVNSAFIYDPDKREAMAAIYHQYLAIGQNHNLPILLSTPTWRASPERIELAGLADRDLNGDNYRFMDELRKEQWNNGVRLDILPFPANITPCHVNLASTSPAPFIM